jgi:hypothetical protein
MVDIIIGLYGKKHVGKTTIANHLHEKHDFAIGDFAAPMRAMINILLQYQGVTAERIAYLNEEGRDREIVPELGWHTLRWAQQSLGHDWGRVLMHDSLWCNVIKNTNVFDNENIVCKNVRYQDEAHLVRSHGGYIIEIQRPNGNGDDHPSENNLIRPDFKVINDTTPENMFFKINHILELIRKDINGTNT